MRMAIVVAAAENDVIGRAGGLPWHLPDDLRRFKALTMGHPLLMGRRTHASIGRALPGRANLVLTRHPARVAEGCIAVASLDEAIRRAAEAAPLMIIGGASLYAETLPYADTIHLTRVHARIDGDVRFPDYEPADWRLAAREHHPPDARHAYAFTFLTLERRMPAAGAPRPDDS